MQLNRLLEDITSYEFKGDPNQEIKGLAYDSREVGPGYLFVAIKGHARDGHDFINDALKKGAGAIVLEKRGVIKATNREIATIQVPDSREALSKLAASFYRHPFMEMNLIGITGTNGKTTTSYLLESILSTAGAKAGVIGTINYRISGRTWDAPVTTPESLELMRILRKMADAGVTDVVMEVSSHALD